MRIKKPKVIAALSLLAVIIIGGAVTAVLINQPETQPNISTVQPTFQTITPNETSIDSWQRVSPDDSDPVYAFSDTIDQIPVTVSQQNLPESFKDNVSGEVADLAKSYSAIDQLKADDTLVYIGNSAKGPQSVIFTKKNLLVLIKSTDVIQDSSWIRYVKELN